MALSLNQSQAILKEFYLKQDSNVYTYLNADIRIAEYMNYYIGFPDIPDRVHLEKVECHILLKYPMHYEIIQFSNYYSHFLECYIVSMHDGSLSLISNNLTTILGVFKRLDSDYCGDFESFSEYFHSTLRAQD